MRLIKSSDDFLFGSIHKDRLKIGSEVLYRTLAFRLLNEQPYQCDQLHDILCTFSTKFMTESNTVIEVSRVALLSR